MALSVTGPFGTFAGLDFGERLAYWGGLLALSLLIGLAARVVCQRVWPDDPKWIYSLRVATLLTLGFTPLLVALTYWIAGPEAGQAMHPVWMALVVFSVPLIARLVKQVFLLGSVRDEADAICPEPKPRLLRRIGDEPGSIWRISGSNHYVDVYTDRGHEKLLMRFSDALEEAEDAPGLRVHRSHWVSPEVIDAVETEGGRMFLRLNCGNRLPVSRAYREAVEASDMLAPLLADPAKRTGSGGSPRSTA